MRLSLDDCDDAIALKLNQQNTNSQCASESEILLSKKCADMSMPCYRFLDLPPFLFVGGHPITLYKLKNNDVIKNFQYFDNSFTGCIRNIFYNNKLIHFSSFDMLEKVGDGIEPGCQKYRPDLCTYLSPCTTFNLKINTSNNQQQVKCVDKWLGHICQCPQRVHSNDGCQLIGFFYFFLFKFFF